jgi:hypothetical protein
MGPTRRSDLTRGSHASVRSKNGSHRQVQWTWQASPISWQKSPISWQAGPRTNPDNMSYGRVPWADWQLDLHNVCHPTWPDSRVPETDLPPAKHSGKINTSRARWAGFEPRTSTQSAPLTTGVEQLFWLYHTLHPFNISFRSLGPGPQQWPRHGPLGRKAFSDVFFLFVFSISFKILTQKI